MAIIRCLAVVSTVGIGIVIILTTQLVKPKNRNNIYFGVVIALSVVCCFSLTLLLYKLLQVRRRMQNLMINEGGEKGAINRASAVDEDDDFLRALSGVPTKLNLKELEIATGGFCKLLGQGGFGSVYEGELADGTKVAVKRLETESKLRSKEFCAEVVTISGIHHINLVRLLGFCSEANHRLLIYEYMENGSLDRWLFQKRMNDPYLEEQIEKKLADVQDDKKYVMLPKEQESPKTSWLSWAVRFRIALQTARALAYLHEECRETILHLDVKPQNILLDSQFHAKVSDFGLSRAINRDQSRLVTSMRGTPGYLAPEWLINAGVTHKSDVYSYGMVLLELVSGRRNVDHSQDAEAWYFPTVAFRLAREMRMEEIVDPALRKVDMSTEEMDQARLAIRVAFWCIQDQVAARPAMSTVVRMLEGTQPVADPPLTGAVSFTNVLVQGGGVEGFGGGIPFLNQPPLQQDKKDQLSHAHPILQAEEPFSISLDSSTPDSPLPPPPCR